MKLLEKGKWGNPWSMEVVCPEESCGAKLLVQEKDVKPIDCRNDNYAECMVCGQQINIQDNILPYRMRIALDKKRKYYDDR